MACATGQKLECFSTGDWQQTHELVGHTSKVNLLAYVPNGRLLVSAAGKSVNLWKMPSGKLHGTLPGHMKLVSSVAVSPDSSFLVTGSEDCQVMLWKLPSGRLRGSYGDHDNYVFQLAISPDCERIASWDFDGQVRLWSVGSRRTISRRKVPIGERILFSPDGRWLVLVPEGGGEVHVLDGHSGELVTQLPESFDATFSSDGAWLATGDGKDVVIWSIASGKK